MSKNYVLYHKDCYDGFGAAWVSNIALMKWGGNTTFIPCKYGDPLPPIDDDSNVYIVDFSYPRDVLIKLDEWTNLQVLDHHKTAQANCEGLDFCEFDMERSGAGLAWDYFFPKLKHPAIIAYTEDRDLWRFKLPNSREVFAYVSSFPMTFEVWDKLDYFLTHQFEECVREGTAILRYENQKVEDALKQATWIDLAGYRVPVVNVPYSMGSVAGEKLLVTFPDAPFAAYYLDRADGEQQWGLRGRTSDEFDVSEIAKMFGGGGHKKASGFVKDRETR